MSGENLNPFDFVMKLKNCSFSEALPIISKDILCNMNNVQTKPFSVHNSEPSLFKLFPDNNYWVEESSGSVPRSELRFVPRGAADGWEDLFPDYN